MRVDPFEEFINAHISSVTLFCKATLSNQSHVDDVVQETFIRAWRYYPTLRAEYSAKSWLIRICRNVITDLSRNWGAPNAQIVEEFEDQTDQFRQSDLLGLMAGLSSEHRDVLVMCGLLGYDYETVSEILEIPIGTIRSRLARARENMSILLRNTEIHGKTGS